MNVTTLCFMTLLKLMLLKANLTEWQAFVDGVGWPLLWLDPNILPWICAGEQSSQQMPSSERTETFLGITCTGRQKDEREELRETKCCQTRTRLRGVVIDQGRWWKVKHHENAFSYTLQRLHFSFPVLYSITGRLWKYQVRSLPHMRRICVRDLTSAWWSECKWCRKKWNWVGKMAAAICWSIVHFTVVCFCWLDCLQVFSSARCPSGNEDVRAAC